MKMKQTFLIAMGAVLGLFGIGTAQAQSSSALTGVKIQSITVTPESGSTTEPLTAGSRVFFDVKLKQTGTSSITVTGNTLATGVSESARPYMELNIPLRGRSLKNGIVSAEGDTSVLTNSAVAFYAGQTPGSDAWSLRFVYVVRPGDLCADLEWAVTNDQPRFSTTITNVNLSIARFEGGNTFAPLSTENMVWADDANRATPTTPIAVNGYSLTVGEAGSSSEGWLFQGLTPVTIAAATDETVGDSVASAASNSLSRNYYFWVEYKDTTDDTWKQIPAGITAMNRDAMPIKVAESATAGLVASFDASYAAQVSGPTNYTFAGKQIFLNIPRNEAAYPAGGEVRLCYGIRPDNTTTKTTYGWWNWILDPAPYVDAQDQTYSVSNASMGRPTSLEIPGLGTVTAKAGSYYGSITASAGDNFTINVAKSGTTNISDRSPLYAVIEPVSTDTFGIAPNRYYVPLDTTGLTTAVTFSVPEAVTSGTAYFRIWVPQLEDTTGDNLSGTLEKPFYLEVTATAHSEDITLLPAEGTASSGVEYYVPTPTVDPNNPTATDSSFLHYTLSVDEASEVDRYFLIHPVGTNDSGELVRIDNTFTYADGRRVLDVISEYVRIQQAAAPSSSATAEYDVRLRAGQTSLDFYVALINEIPANYLAGTATSPSGGTITVPAQPHFVAKTCDASGTTITGLNDRSSDLEPTVMNRAPTITGQNAPTNAAVNAGVNFTFNVADVVSDYLIAQLGYGDGSTDTKLYVDEDRMERIMGATTWERERATLVQRYDLTDDDIIDRSVSGAEQILFEGHTYSSGNTATWTFTVIDSAGGQASTSGVITLQSSQTFTFHVLYTPTAPGAGGVAFDRAGQSATWSWGSTYTYSALPKSGSTTVDFKAVPFSAGHAQPNGLRDGAISDTQDSFFYKWDNYFAAGGGEGGGNTALPESSIYENTITVNRAQTGNGGQAQNQADWQDITLRAIFVAEYNAGDAIDSNVAASKIPTAVALGDYNQDGVPDGWLLTALGESENTRAIIEGASQLPTVAGDGLPALGWGPSDNAYRYGAAAGARPSGSFAIEEDNFTLKMRVRGRDDALNAAITSSYDQDAEGGKWVSNVQWVVAVRPEVTEEVTPAEPDPFRGVNVGTYDATSSTYNAAWRTIRLFNRAGTNIAYTGDRIPYNTTLSYPGDTDWKVVVDANGYNIQANDVDGAPYRYTTVYVNTNGDDEDYETFRVVYSNGPWGYQRTAYVYMTRNPDADEEDEPEFIELRDGEGNPIFDPVRVVQETDDDGNPVFDAQGNPVYLRLMEDGNPVTETFWVAGAPVGVPFPFASAEEQALAEVGNVSEYQGQVWDLDGAYHFSDTRVAGGMLSDEPFYTNRLMANTAYISPILTCWLERFPNLQSNDQDGDGMPNGYEYYFWYYASRIAYGSVFTIRDEEGNIVQQQKNTAIWPAIDMRHRTGPNEGSGFVLGRRFNNAYDPDQGLTQGNFWTPIPAADVLAAFHPLMGGNSGADLDNDGLSIAEEITLGTNPIDCDTDGDGMPDGWEVAFELDPLRADANANPDGDYYATATLELYPEYHHLFEVESFTEASGVNMPTGRSVFYDYEDAAFYSVAENQVNLTIAGDALVSFNATLADVQAWAAGTAHFASIVKTKTLSDFDLYQALGFNPNTGWYGGRPSNANPTKFSVCQPVNTQPFTNVQEFNSAVRNVRRQPPTGGATMAAFISRAEATSNPNKADTNDDGIPDGWANYVGFTAATAFGRDQDGDGLTAVQEFQCRLANLLVEDPMKAEGTWPETLKSAAHDIGGATWANKLLPTDPWDPDTDGDTVIDGDEGKYFTYGPTSDTLVEGGGGDPNRVDTDGDGIMDGWEFRYGIAADEQAIAAATDDETDMLDEALYEELSAFAPDPTNAQDRSVDYDRDGLTNYQEYLTGVLRHFRYDLGTQAARLYKDEPGAFTVGPLGIVEWTTAPNAYSIVEDLGWSNAAPSHTYAAVLVGEGDLQRREDIVVNAIKQPWAADVVISRQTVTSTAPVDDPAAIVSAFNRKWTSTIVCPTGTQRGARSDIEDLARELDMAYLRDLQGQEVPTATVIYLVGRLDDLVENFQDDDETLPNLTTEVKALWAARRNQLLRYFGIGMAGDQPVAGGTEVDPAYSGLAGRTEGLTAVYNGASGFAAPSVENEQNVYEETLVAATTPGIQQQYRAAIRGLNGGILINDGAAYLVDRGEVFVAPVGYHPALRHYTDGSAVGAEDGYRIMAVDFGTRMPTAGVDAAIASMEGMSPFFNDIVAWDPFVTTNPVVADSDADGMDDYWELFHGLNPILGDYSNLAYGNASDGFTNYSIDKVHDVYLGFNGTGFDDDTVEGDEETVQEQTNLFFVDVLNQAPAGKGNPFLNPALEKNAVTGYDYYSYPWLAGAPFADPDGDGLLNAEEAVNPNGNAERYGTDPSPLWMTDPGNANSFVTRFYGGANGVFSLALDKWRAENPDAEAAEENAAIAACTPSGRFAYVVFPAEDFPGTFASFFPYEINEGFDTDGDGVPDKVELEAKDGNRGDPQSLRTPSRQQVAYFGGKGAMQSMAEVHFGPYALQTFTIECWVKPDANQDVSEVILVDRPWRFYETDEDDDGAKLSPIRHNFRLGLKVAGSTLTPFADYTSAGTTGTGNGDTPVFSKQATGTAIPAGTWTHLAVTYNGSTLTVYVNGAATGSQTATLIPANGLISVADSDPNDVQRYTYRPAPILIGAGPADNAWVADLAAAPGNTTVERFYAGRYSGYIDEVRIWNGVRTAGEISGNMSKTFSQAELLQQRYNVFAARYNGAGIFEENTPAELLAMYTFEDLLAGTLEERQDDEETVKVPATKPFETYPGEKTIGGADVAGSLLYRRTKFPKAKADAYTTLPTAADVFTSYYASYPDGLRWAHGTENEYVPMAHSTIAHLPLADVEREEPNLISPVTTVNGTPELIFPSGNPLNLKPADSVYWTPYGAGKREGASTTQVYPVKVTGNPYAHRYHASIFFDVPTHRALPAFSTQVPADLLILGDAFAKYDESTWADGSPTTDPDSGNGDGDDAASEGSLGWFEHHNDEGDADKNRTDEDLSEGGEWLEDNIGRGQTTDTDQDLMPNWWENYYGLDPEDPTGDNGPHGDPDGDYLTNYAEWLARSNPTNPSTAGNGVPDFHIPIWARRGRPTFGLLYTDNDFMEDHWEAQYRNELLSVDHNDALADADNDGWSNWAEARANFRTGRHSTNPLSDTSITANGNFLNEFPTPAIRLTVDYFGDQNVYTNVTAGTNIVVHGYTADGNNSAPDVTYHLPLTTSRAEGDAGALGGNVAQEMGNWRSGTLAGYVHMGNVVPGSFQIAYSYVSPVSSDVVDTSLKPTFYVTDRSPDGTSAATGQLYIVCATFDGADGCYYESFGEDPIGTIDYATGAYTVDFGATSPAAEVWEDGVFSALCPVEFEEGELPVANVGATLVQEPTTGAYFERYAFPFTAFNGNLTARYALQAGASNTFTLVQPDSGHIREGINNFFVFVDFNGDGYWNKGEPAGVPDQHDVDIGYDLVNRPLHVQLTEVAPPGTIRFDVGTVLQALKDALAQGTANKEDDGGMTSSIPNGYYDNGQMYLDPQDFETIIGDNSTGTAELRVTMKTVIGTGAGDVSTDYPKTILFRKPYNKNKPYISEDEIYAQDADGFDPPDSPAVSGVIYLVYLVPNEKQAVDSADLLTDYCIGAVTNTFAAMRSDLTELVSAAEGNPNGGAVRHNTELSFAWKSNVQVPNFKLTIKKTHDAKGQPASGTVFDRTIRGVTAYAKDLGDEGTEQFRYRYALPRGIGELGQNGDTLFGNGTYAYEIALNPYSGDDKILTGTFNIRLRESGNTGTSAVDLREDPTAAISTPENTQDSYYLRAKIHYAGVLKETADFGGAKIIVEAHYSGSFNGDPIAANSDILAYDADDERYANLNRTIKMRKDNTYKTSVKEPDGSVLQTDAFFTTDFDAEIRGLPSADPVYVTAFFDLDGDGERDSWEPWGYATQGQSAAAGYYFDPLAVTPVRSGAATNVEFYIQDVDSDNDKIADAYEWKQAGKPSADFNTWNNRLTGISGDQKGQALWTYDSNGRLALTAYGAQLYGLNILSVEPATGAVVAEGMPENLEVFRDFIAILGPDTALNVLNALSKNGCTDCELQVTSMDFDGENVTFTWDVVGVNEDGAPVTLADQPASVVEALATAVTNAKFAIYGKASLDDANWTLVRTAPVAGSTSNDGGKPSTTLSISEATATLGAQGTAQGEAPKFFKVLLSTEKNPAETL